MKSSQEVEDYFAFCMTRCAQWFGAPPDPQWPTEFHPGTGPKMIRFWPLRNYLVEINYSKDPLSLAEDIIRTAVRRTCYYRPGPWRLRWTYDLLDSWTCQRLLAENITMQFCGATSDDVGNYLQKRWSYASYAYAWEPLIRVSRAIRPCWTRTIRPCWLWGRFFHPLDATYWAAIWLLGEHLEQIVGWEGLCALARSCSYRDWLRSLPEGQRDLVRQAVERE